MKKRVLSLLLALVLTIGTMAVPAAALGGFSDVSDRATAQNVEVLRLLGVIDGDGNGRFRPSGTLTRAEFCKMTVALMGNANAASRYQTMTIFPDVRAKHWAAGYINYAVRGETKLLSGMPDGTFRPDQAITYGEAVTILVRLLGYTDADCGGVWPAGYINLAKYSNLSRGVELSGSATITRAQAAQLFVNLLHAEKKEGEDYFGDLGEQYTLVSVDGGTGEMRLLNEKGELVTEKLEKPAAVTELTGLKGYLVKNAAGRVRTFLPATGDTISATSNTAVIISADKSTAGLNDLAGGRTDYKLYKNGVEIYASDLKRFDVATYNAASNVITLCDTRLSVYYESCDPKPSEAAIVTVLGGTKFNVLPSAQDSLAKYKPGEQVTLFLTADGQIAGAAESGGAARGNAIGVVSGGKVQLICGTTMITLACSAENVSDGVVRISSSGKDRISLSPASGGSVSGDLTVSTRTIGGKKLANNALIYENGKLIALSALTSDTVSREQIVYARTNSAGEVDLVVINRSTGERFGRVFWEVTSTTDPETGEREYTEKLGVDEGGTKTDTFKMKYNVKTGDFAAFKINQGGTGFSQMVKLTELSKVSYRAWVGDSAVTFGGRTYEVPSSVLCYNSDSEEWITLDQAKAYADSANLFVKDGVVRVVEVGG